jgi:hypothetical protein
MSTKTTFKRIALATVATLGFGLVSAAPSQALPQADSFTSAATSSTGVVNVAQTLSTTVSFIADTTTASMTIVPTVLTAPATAGAFAVTGAVTTASVSTNTSYSTGLVVTSTTTGRVTAAVTLSFTPDKVGQYTIKLATTGGTNNQLITWTVTSTDPAGPSATFSTVAMASTACSFTDGNRTDNCIGSNYPGIYSTATDTTTATVALSNATTKVVGSLIASFKLKQSNGASNTMVTTVPWTVAITSGPGNIQIGYIGRLVTAKSVTEGLTTSGSDGYQLMTSSADTPAYFVSDGTTGTTVITFSAGGVLVATRTITVYGPVATLTATQAKTVYAVGANAAGISVVAKDANGVVVANTAITAASATVAAATINTPVSTSALGAAAAFDVTGVAAGTSVVTFTAGTITTTSTVTVGKSTVAEIKLSTDATTYMPGSKVVLTGVFNDAAAGKAVADGSYTLTATSSLALPVALPSAAATAVVGGKVTWTINAPTTEGEFTLTVTVGLISGTATAVSENAPATAAAQAAADAAAEATDAANAATDAANAAAEAADAATAAAQDAADAVAALATQVAEQINALKMQNDALRKQLVAITNLIIKIQKKVKA